MVREGEGVGWHLSGHTNDMGTKKRYELKEGRKLKGRLRESTGVHED